MVMAANDETTGWLAAQTRGDKCNPNEPETSQRENVAAGSQFGGSAGWTKKS
jgi:hypothetical protein